MQAKISYTIDINLVPREINRLLIPEINSLKDALEKFDICASPDNIDVFLSKLDLLRKHLAQVDTRAMECYSMAQGYRNAFLSDEEAYIEAEDGTLPE